MLQLKNRSKGRKAKRESGHYELQIGKEQTAILVEKSRTATWKARQRERKKVTCAQSEVRCYGWAATHLRAVVSNKLPTQRGSNGCV